MFDLMSFSAGGVLGFVGCFRWLQKDFLASTEKMEKATAILETANNMFDAVIDINAKPVGNPDEK